MIYQIFKQENIVRTLTIFLICVYFFSWNEKVAAGQSRPKSAPAFRPRFCFLDKKVLRFYAYFEEHAGLDDRAPEKRIRHVQILYHLEDDSISILEPRVQVNKNYLLQIFKEKKRFSSSLSYTFEQMKIIDIVQTYVLFLIFFINDK